MNRFDTSTFGVGLGSLFVGPSSCSSEPCDRKIRSGVQLLNYAHMGAVWFAALASPFPETWLSAKRDTATVIIVQRSSSRRKITLSEARRLALSSIHEAEERRLRFAEEEATRAWRFEADV